MSDKTDIALKLFEAFLEWKVQKWMKRLDEVAEHIGVTSDEVKRFLKPILQKLLDKHFTA